MKKNNKSTERPGVSKSYYRQFAPNEQEELKCSLFANLEFLYQRYKIFFRVGKKNQLKNVSQYISGLFQCERKKRNMERIVEKVPGSNYENLQHFISNSPWETEGLMKSLAKNISAKLQPYGLIACTVDEKAHIKKGTNQWE